MAHHYAGQTPEEFERTKAEKISSLEKIVRSTEEGSVTFEGVNRALQNEDKEAEMRLEGMELAKKDNAYFEILEHVHESDSHLKEELWQQSAYSRTEFFSTLSNLNEEGYIDVNGSVETTDTGEAALTGTYMLMESHSE